VGDDIQLRSDSICKNQAKRGNVGDLTQGPSGWTSTPCAFAKLRIELNRLPETRVILYCEEDGSCPFLEWFDQLPGKAQDKCFLRVERLRDMGHELRRPEADHLRQGMRASLQGIHYRILYFFHGAVAAVVSHGIVKEAAVPPTEIERAMRRKKQFEANPSKHTYEET
jgi:phage-related protein